MPCAGTLNRYFLYSDILQEIQALLSTYTNCEFLIGGDFNVDLDCNRSTGDVVNRFMVDNGLSRCDVLFSTSTELTYVNEALNCSTTIDYLATSSPECVVGF